MLNNGVLHSLLLKVNQPHYLGHELREPFWISLNRRLRAQLFPALLQIHVETSKLGAEVSKAETKAICWKLNCRLFMRPSEKLSFKAEFSVEPAEYPVALASLLLELSTVEDGDRAAAAPDNIPGLQLF